MTRSASATAANPLAAQVEMFQTRIRHTGYATSMDIAGALFGGSAPFVATDMIAATENSLAPGFLLIGAALISSLVMVETAKQPLHDV